MINYKQTAQQYKDDFDTALSEFLKLHEGAELNKLDFINRELAEWHGIKTILETDSLLYSLLPADLFEKGFILDKAIAEIGANGKEFVKYNCDAILKFLDTELSNLNGKPSSSEHENPYPLIFKNGYAYQMFLELKQLTVRERTVVADYSFIFHKMKAKSLMGAIKLKVTEPDFIDFLNTSFQAGIIVKKLPIRNPDSKQELYKAILDKYKAYILSET